MTGGGFYEADEALASIEAYVRIRIASPCKSWFSPKEIGPPCGLSAPQAGSALAALAADPPDGLAFEKRPGGRGGAKWRVTRVDPSRSERTWWVERGERRGTA